MRRTPRSRPLIVLLAAVALLLFTLVRSARADDVADEADHLFTLVGMDPLTAPGRGIWQCLGMVIGVYGIGYWCASRDPVRHWPIVFVGLLGKIFGPIGFIWTATRGEIPWAFGVTIPTNDLLWWIPFALILRAAWKR